MRRRRLMNNDNTTIIAVSDGFHTTDELYHHRAMLFAVICNQNEHLAWKSKLHHDGTMYENYFIAGIDTPDGQFTYHQKMIYWDLFKIPAIAHSPELDGHISKDVNRLMSLKVRDYKIGPEKLMSIKSRPDMKNNTIKIDVTKFRFDELNRMILLLAGRNKRSLIF
jgi:hypothetical protein